MKIRLQRAAGFTLLELMIAATVFVLVSGAVVTSLVAASTLNMVHRETGIAARAAQSRIEELKSTAYAEIFARYNATGADDPAAGSSPGAGFAVAGLTPLGDDADGLVGSIEFPGDGFELREGDDDLDLGLPRDLNGDGEVDGEDHAGDYRILPVRVRIDWNGQGRRRSFELVTVLTDT